MGIQQYFCATSFRNLCACMQTVMSLQGMLQVIGILCCKHLMMVAIATPYKFQPEYIAHKLSCCCLKIHIHCAGTDPGGCPTFGYSHTCNIIAHHKQGQIEKIDRGGGGGGTACSTPSYTRSSCFPVQKYVVKKLQPTCICDMCICSKTQCFKLNMLGGGGGGGRGEELRGRGNNIRGMFIAR